MDEDGAFVHGVAGGVLGVALDDDPAAVHVSAQGVARGAQNGDGPSGKAAADIALAQAVFDDHVLIGGFPDDLIELLKIEPGCIDKHCVHTFLSAAQASISFRSSRVKAMSWGFSQISAKSMEERGVSFRMRLV